MPFVFVIIRLLSFLPLRTLRRMGNFLGIIGYTFAVSRRNVGMKNLSLCFPDMPMAEKQLIIKEHFKALMGSVLEYSLVFYASKERIMKIVKYKNIEVLQKHYNKRPIILLCPHFVGLDMAGLRGTIEYTGFTLAVKQKNAYVNKMLVYARSRFMADRGGEIITRDHGILPIVRRLRKGTQIFYYLPDQDFGAKDSVFVPFFAYPECTNGCISY